MTPYEQAIAQINQKYSGTTTTSAPPKQPGFLDKVGQTGSNIANNIFNTVTAPFQKVIGSGVRALQSIPPLLKGDQKKATEIQNKPFTSPTGYKSNTLMGASVPENLGSAAQAASFLAPSTGLAKYGATGFLAAGGATLQNPNASGGQVLGNAVLGGVTDVAGQQAVQAAQNLSTHPIFQRPTPIMNPYDVQAATAARESASTGGVNAINEMNQTVGADETALGNEFRQGAQKIEAANPGKTLNLTGKQLDALNNLKESKLFTPLRS